MRKAAAALVASLLVWSVLPPTSGAAAASLSSDLAAPVIANNAAASGQLRAFWVDAFGDGLWSASQIDDVIAATKAAHLNAIVAQVVRRGDCFCDRALAPRTDQAGVDPAPFDPLDALIDRAHANGIEVHAWVIATAVWRGATPPPQPTHPFNLHGPSAPGSANWLTRRSDGLQQLNTDWILDPGHPDAAQWIVDNALSIVRNYAVDGINLDRIRYPDGNLGTNVPSWGYNDTAVARFNALFGRSGVPANTDPQWTQWRRDQVTAIVRKVYVESFAIRPSVRVSADTITYGYGPQHGAGFTGTRTYAEVLQDWDGWLREGILDTNILMNYKRDSDASQAVMFREWSDFAKDDQYGRQNVIGTAGYLNDIAATVTQTRVAVAPSALGNTSAGWAGYSYRTPDALADSGARSGATSRAQLIGGLTTPTVYDPITPPVFAATSPVASMPWKTAPAKGHLRGGTSPSARVDLFDAGGALVRTQVADGAGWFAFVDLAPGAYRVLANGVAIGGAQVFAGQLANVSAQVGPAPSPSPSPSPGTCVSSVGPGIPPPASVSAGIAGFHASWYGQSGYMTLCPGDRSTATVAYYNSGSRGWVSGRMGEVAYLGTWRPEPGQDMPSSLGGDGTNGSPNTQWPRYDRIAVQPAPYVGPGQVSWFQFTVLAPTTPGTYRLYLRPLVEGATWMEDYGVFWLVTVR
ncbi:MAG TPA: family 10 glycosylhydrolase [Candidatus Limnocylindria bacterium]|nr:family 10 glycosylhydrolase [Candidatus Limnocylindria bacterium]